ncbi:hypothetical protein DYH09_09700 [bacterium CPR1]|nr:hypothetical protein [bacterium CPR1]
MLRLLCLLLLVLPAQAQNFLALNLNQSQVVGGATVGGTVALTNPAPAGGTVVTLWSGDDVRVPSSVIIPAGAKYTGFSVATSPTSQAQYVRIQATAGSLQQQTFLQVLPSGQQTASQPSDSGLQMYKEYPMVGPVYGSGIPYYYPYGYYGYPGPNPWAEPTHFDRDGYPMIRSTGGGRR